MSTITATPLTTPSDPAEFSRLTVDQYERMVADGTIAEEDRVELLDGILVRTSTWCSTAGSWPGSPWPTSCPRDEPGR